MDPLALALEGLPKALVYAPVLLSVGACAARPLFRARVAHLLTDEQEAAYEAALGLVMRRVGVLLVMALALRVWAHTAVAFSLIEAFSWGNLRTIAWESQWGQAWQAQFAGALVLAVVAQSLESFPTPGWILTSAMAAWMCFLLPRLGHAAGQPDRVLVHGWHILGAGIWLGTLGAIVLASQVGSGALAVHRAALRNQVLRSFSPVAFTGSALLAATGAWAVWSYLGSLANLVTTAYGRLLLLKLFLVMDVATCGFLNWRQLKVLDEDRERSVRAAFVVLEVSLAIAVVLVTAILTETEHP